ALSFEDGPVALGKVRRADVGYGRPDHHVGAGQFLLAQLAAHDRDRLVDDAQQVARGAAGGAVGDVDRDHHVRPQFARGVHRYRAGHAAVDVMLATDRHRLEHPGDAAGGAHRLPGVATYEHRALAGLQPGGDRGERNRHAVEWPVRDQLVDV